MLTGLKYPLIWVLFTVLPTSFTQASSIVCSTLIDPSNVAVIGILTESMNGQKTIALDSYIGASHEKLAIQLQKSHPENPIEKILWAGEALIEVQPQRIIFLKANETSGMIKLAREGRAGTLSPDLKDINFSESSVEALESAIKDESLAHPNNLEIFKFNEDSDNRIMSTSANLSAFQSRHNMGNVVAHLRIVFHYNIDPDDRMELSQNVINDLKLFLELIHLHLQTEVRSISQEHLEEFKKFDKLAKSLLEEKGLGWSSENWREASELVKNTFESIYNSRDKPWFKSSL